RGRGRERRVRRQDPVSVARAGEGRASRDGAVPVQALRTLAQLKPKAAAATALPQVVRRRAAAAEGGAMTYYVIETRDGARVALCRCLYHAIDRANAINIETGTVLRLVQRPSGMVLSIHSLDPI